jgi:hypothetical protein
MNADWRHPLRFPFLIFLGSRLGTWNGKLRGRKELQIADDISRASLWEVMEVAGNSTFLRAPARLQSTFIKHLYR